MGSKSAFADVVEFGLRKVDRQFGSVGYAFAIH